MAPMNNRLLVPRQTPGLLDLVPGAAAAYSLRSLSRSYAGPVVTVRRSSDDAEDSFTAAEVSDGTLAAFCGAGDGFVKTWFDQSGNARDASQTTSGNQPKICESGVVVTDGGFPAIRFDETPRYLNAGNIGIGDVYSMFVLFRTLTDDSPQHNPVSTYHSSTGGTDGMQFVELPTVDRFVLAIGNASGDSFNASKTEYGFVAKETLMAAFVDGTVASIDLRRNGASLLSDTAAAVTNIAHGDFWIGQAQIYVTVQTLPERALNGYVKEVVVYQSNVSSQVDLVEGNMAWAWS